MKILLSIIVVGAVLLFFGLTAYNTGHKVGMRDMGTVLCDPYEPGYDNFNKKYVCFDGNDYFIPNVSVEVGR